MDSEKFPNDDDEAELSDGKLVVKHDHPGFIRVLFETTTDDRPFVGDEPKSSRHSFIYIQVDDARN